MDTETQLRAIVVDREGEVLRIQRVADAQRLWRTDEIRRTSFAWRLVLASARSIGSLGGWRRGSMPASLRRRSGANVRRWS